MVAHRGNGPSCQRVFYSLLPARTGAGLLPVAPNPQKPTQEHATRNPFGSCCFGAPGKTEIRVSRMCLWGFGVWGGCRGPSARSLKWMSSRPVRWTRGRGNIMPRLAGSLSHKAGKKPSLKTNDNNTLLRVKQLIVVK